MLIMAGALVFSPGCASKRTHTEQQTHAVTGQALPLSPGETIRLVPTTIINPTDSLEFPIDPEGDVHLFLGKKVHVAGLTPDEATVVIRNEYQPWCFKDWHFTVARVQQVAPPL